MKKSWLIGLLLLLSSSTVWASTWSGWYPTRTQASNAALASCRVHYRAPCVVKQCQTTYGYKKRWRCEASRMKRWDDRGRGRGWDDRGRGRGWDDHGSGHGRY
ncbi:MAG: hypothetical protein WAQ53_02995 [Thiofilum sp.]|uniref:hypothetical protein n=1 Tax=Thiofilum sp. TaxID=2212733 RepID=UPI0025F767C3|nr:hypothetical protein [Thiofilum sp.]MBK8454656.1 hypothetical protein [Thiofilum sp.]